MTEQKERLGQQVGEYRLFQQLGRGSFGTVYLAEHLHDHSQAAVKLLRFQITNGEGFKDFLNEARTMMRLHHPHIVPLLDFSLMRDDTPYLVMEYAAGGTLRQHYPKGTKLPLETIDTYVTQLASALEYAHDHRVIHRDVKPKNVLLRADGTILLSDFGIAKVLEQSSFISLQTQVGTPAYMAPEQSRGKPCPASDQYALAVIVYEWLTGRLPFQGAPLEVMLQHRVDTSPSLQTLCPEVPTQVAQVVLQALAKTPEERFRTVQQFVQALHTALQKSSPIGQMIQPRDQPPVLPPIERTQLSAPALPLITHDQAVPPALSGTSLPQTIWPIDMVAPSELRSGFHRPPEISFAPTDEMQTPLSPQFAHSGETQAIQGKQRMEFPLQPPGPEDESPTTQDLHAGSVQFVPAHSVTIVPHSYNKRFAGRTFLVTLLCLVLLASLVGGGIWTFTTQQHSLNSPHTTATPFATAPASQYTMTTPFATASASQYTTATAQANIILTDALNQNNHNWPVGSYNNHDFAFKDGAYHIANNSPDHLAIALLPDEDVPEPFTYMTTLNEVKGDDGTTDPTKLNLFGLVLRYNQQDQNNQRFYCFEVKPTNNNAEYQFRKYDSSQTDPWTVLWQQPFGSEYHLGQGSANSNTIKVVANGSNFTFLVNGNQVGSTSDNSFQHGQIGMLVNQGGAEIAFSNLILTHS